MGLGSKLFQKLLFVFLFSLFVTFLGFSDDFVQNFLIVIGITGASWITVIVLLRFFK